MRNFPEEQWNLEYHGQLLNFCVKSKQEMAHHFERFLLLYHVMIKHGAGVNVYIIESIEFRYLRMMDPTGDLFGYPTMLVVSRINVVLDILQLYLSVVYRSLISGVAMLSGLIRIGNYRSGKKRKVDYIWDGVNVNELSVDSKQRYFAWIVDGKEISSQDVLFIVPRDASRGKMPDLYGCDYQIYTIMALYRIISISTLVRCVGELVMWMAKSMLLMPKGLVSLKKAEYFTRIMRLKPVIDHFKPSCYISNMSQMGNEDPVNVYLDSIGVATIMYSYSANAYLFGDEDCVCDFRAVTFANIIASQLIVWHKDFKRFIEKHPQEKVQIKVVGPLMPGDEGVLKYPRAPLRERFANVSLTTCARFRYISVFDVAPIARWYTIANSIYPEPYTEEHGVLFLNDIVRLLRDFDTVVILFKPQRSLGKTKFSYAAEFRDLLGMLKASGRGIIVDDAINPWIPVALADICIAMPFTSPVLAGIHYGIPGLFHDAAGIVHHHRYRKISRLITHGYDQLASTVAECLSDRGLKSQEKDGIWTEARQFVGEFPGTNSSVAFREWLNKSRRNAR